MFNEYVYKISIIIPHYNIPDLLEKLLDTIPDFDDIQVIVIDDHSDGDATVKFQELKNSNMRKNILFLNNDSSEHNAGVARNIGLDHAEGKWLLFADSDDYFTDGFYDIMLPYLNSDYDIVFFAPESIQLDTGNSGCRNTNYVEYIRHYLNNPCFKTESALRYLWRTPWSKMIRNSLVQSNGIRFSQIMHSNDEFFSVKTGFYAEKIAASMHSIYCVTRHTGSLTTDLSLETFDIRTRERIRIIQFLKTAGFSKKELPYTGICYFAYSQLFIIILRGYGFRCFFKYLNLYRKNGTLFFSLSMLNPVIIVRVLRNVAECAAEEREIKNRYEIKSLSCTTE